MKHFILLEDTDGGSVHIQALKLGSMEELAQDEAGQHTPASLLAASLIEHAITCLGVETIQETAKARINAAVAKKH